MHIQYPIIIQSLKWSVGIIKCSSPNNSFPEFRYPINKWRNNFVVLPKCVRLGNVKLHETPTVALCIHGNQCCVTKATPASAAAHRRPLLFVYFTERMRYKCVYFADTLVSKADSRTVMESVSSRQAGFRLRLQHTAVWACRNLHGLLTVDALMHSKVKYQSWSDGAPFSQLWGLLYGFA